MAGGLQGQQRASCRAGNYSQEQSKNDVRDPSFIDLAKNKTMGRKAALDQDKASTKKTGGPSQIWRIKKSPLKSTSIGEAGTTCTCTGVRTS